MEIVITIDDGIYDDYLKQGTTLPKYGTAIDSLYEALWNGTPLPKGHGRLIDADDIALIDEQFYVPSDYYVAESAINDAPTIIEAEGSENE